MRIVPKLSEASFTLFKRNEIYFFSFRQIFCIPQLKFDEIKKSLFNFGSILAQFELSGYSPRSAS